MTKYTKAELEKMLDLALLQRKQAYKIRTPKFFITALNNQIFDLRVQLSEVQA